MKRLLLFCLFFIGLGWALWSFPGLATKGQYDSLVLDFRESIGSEKIAAELKSIAQTYNITPTLNSQFSNQDNVYIVKGDKTLLNLLRNSPLAKDTEYIEPNYVYTIPDLAKNLAKNESFSNDLCGEFSDRSTFPNDTCYHKQWNFDSIAVENAWKETKGKGVTVAVIDTGISKVSDLEKTEFVEGYDFVNDRVDASDDNGHGTHVAGTIAQSTNNNIGVTGIAYEASLMPLKVLGADGGGTITDIAEAIKFAADHNADVINMSLGGGGESQIMQEAIEYAHSKGVVIVAAAGNSNDNSAGYPARYSRVIGVSSFGPTGEKAPYSNYGAGVDISAPGGAKDGSEEGGILQQTIDPDTGKPVFAAFEGTSMASPHVAAVAALIKATGIKEPDQVREILLQSAKTVNEDPLNHFGAGKLNANAAVQLAQKGQLNFRDFFRWLRDNGYLSLRFWIDGGVVALPMKLAMVLGSYLLAWLLGNYLPLRWNLGLSSGLIAGSSGLFFLRGFYIFDLPQWPMRVLGSSLPELGGAIQGSSALNPFFASVLIPGLLIIFLLNSPGKWASIGIAIGVASCLTVSAFVDPTVWGLGSGGLAQGFLIVNALLCLGLAHLAIKTEEKTA